MFGQSHGKKLIFGQFQDPTLFLSVQDTFLRENHRRDLPHPSTCSPFGKCFAGTCTSTYKPPVCRGDEGCAWPLARPHLLEFLGS